MLLWISLSFLTGFLVRICYCTKIQLNNCTGLALPMASALANTVSGIPCMVNVFRYRLVYVIIINTIIIIISQCLENISFRICWQHINILNCLSLLPLKKIIFNLLFRTIYCHSLGFCLLFCFVCPVAL